MKKFFGLSVIAIVVMGTRSALATEPGADLEPQFASDVQSIPADQNVSSACPVIGRCSEFDCPQAIGGCETGHVPVICDGYEVPRLALNVDASLLHRQNPRRSVLFVKRDTGATSLDASQFCFGDQSGLASSVTCNSTENYGLELRNMWIGDAIASASRTVPDAPGWRDQLSYQSCLKAAEPNIRKHFDWFDGLIGFRYANSKELLSGLQSRPGKITTTTWNAQNNLFGAQIRSSSTAGIDGNSAGTSFTISDNFVPFSPFDFANASLQLTPHVTLRGGYQILWFDGVAVASRQVLTTGSSNFVGQAASHVDSAGTILNQCAKPGLEVTW